MADIDYAARVAKGAALLDDKRPGWEQLINLGTPDVSNGRDCVTAQLSGVNDWVTGMKQLELTSGDDGTYVSHGFNVEACDGDCYGGDECQQQGEYEKLNDLWREVITERRAAQRV